MPMRVSSGSRCYKSFTSSNFQILNTGTRPKPAINPSWLTCSLSSSGSCSSFHINLSLVNLMKLSIRGRHCFPEIRDLVSPQLNSSALSIGSSLRSFSSKKSRRFLSSYPLKDEGVLSGNKLPWLAAANSLEKAKWSDKSTKRKGGDRSSRSSWKESDSRSDRMRSSWDYSTKTSGEKGNRSSRDEPEKRNGKAPIGSANRSTWEVSAEKFARQGIKSADERRESRRTIVDNEEQQNDDIERGGSYEEVEDEETEAIADPRWDKIKSRFKGMVDERAAPERPEFQRWNKQESWGRKTWREASESTLPKMIGEGVYGIGPVLAALSAGRREFYALYMQEGIDLNNNNKKKKDKKGFEKVLRLAEKNALTIKEISKHDLNMISDNRPHQGLVLDASPLEMVKIKELDPVLLEEDKDSLWLALDEVTDPQNLGAIIRSAYFFGASGVVLCAKNSAPLSGVVSKASAGSLELMELRYCKNMMQFLTSSAENGWRVLGASVSSKSIALNEIAPGAPTILVLGSEGTGLRPLVERSCSQLVRIPGNIPVEVTIDKENDIETTQPSNVCLVDEFQSFMAVESLNVSVAAGVLIHHLIGNNYKNE
ncbi:uncharacterized protein LOC120071698 [Benincasa hispida]|uniref:uncharacterized protein LOC120071698 n=1 Tax=Benincasa hispida TaxID=102211 RepID=UPI001900F18E|nr:uncharacterized protein LOC120071698 [Benincasa hispida]XP_038880008.1 uncharacterized protein LOC120071698 [Benincasa hispida]